MYVNTFVSQKLRSLRGIFFALAAILLPASLSIAQEIRLRSGSFDPLSAEYQAARQLAPLSVEAPAEDEQRLVLVQWADGLSDEKLQWLRDQGGTPISYVPEGAYLALLPAKLDPAQLTLAANGASAARWVSPLNPAWKLDRVVGERIRLWKAAAERVKLAGGTIDPEITKPQPYKLQIAKTGGEKAFLTELNSVATGVSLHSDWETFQTWYFEAIPTVLDRLAGTNLVFWIEPDYPIKLLGEREGMTLTPNLTEDGKGVFGAGGGYQAWLNQVNLSGAGQIVHVMDDGLSKGLITNEPGSAHVDILGRIVGIDNGTADPLGDSGGGHGHLNASIIMGQPIAGGGRTDAGGYVLGQGVAPNARVFASKIFRNGLGFDPATRAFGSLVSQAHAAGARVSNNSWGFLFGFGEYSTDSQLFDRLTRDATDLQLGLQAMCFVFSAGNDGPFIGSVSPPATAKNVISVGAGENSDGFDINDRSGVGSEGADSIRDIIDFSSRGPAQDGRLLPTIFAPGTHVGGAASDSPNFDGSGVSGRQPGSLEPGEPPTATRYYPAFQTDYTWSSGTSHSGPVVAGAAVLLREDFTRRFGQEPSPATIRALLVAGAIDAAGGNDGDDGVLEPIPNNIQGWGRANLVSVVNNAPMLVYDQQTILRGNGERFSRTIQVLDPSKPLKVVLTWTDPYASIFAAKALVNDLNLEVDDVADLYRGNQFVQGESTPGGAADDLNNLEVVLLKPPFNTVIFSMDVIAELLGGDALPGQGTSLEQDFALVVLNAFEPDLTRGQFSLDKSNYHCTELARLTLIDLDRRGESTLTVVGRSENAGDVETITLFETPVGSGDYRGQVLFNGIPTPGPESGILTVAAEDTISFTYVDNTDGESVIAGAPILCDTLNGTDSPDIAAPLIRLTEISAALGELLPIDLIIQNVGNGAAPASEARLFASTDQLIDGQGNDILLTVIAVPALEIDESSSFTVATGNPILVSTSGVGPQGLDELPPGLYHIGVIVDIQDDVLETNEVLELTENNTFLAADRLTLIALPPGAPVNPIPEHADFHISINHIFGWEPEGNATRFDAYMLPYKDSRIQFSGHEIANDLDHQPAPREAIDVVAFDMNDDSYDDVIVGWGGLGASNPGFQLFLNSGGFNPTFTTTPTMFRSVAAFQMMTPIFFNDDDKLDVLAVSREIPFGTAAGQQPYYGPETISALGQLYIFEGAGADGFTPMVWGPTTIRNYYEQFLTQAEIADGAEAEKFQLAFPRSARTAGAADFDNDGDTDLVVGADQGDVLVWYENNQDVIDQMIEDEVDPLDIPPLTLSAIPIDSRSLTTGSGDVFALKVVDLDGNGFWDVVGVSVQDDSVFWYANRGLKENPQEGEPKITWAPRHLLAVGLNGVNSLDLADLEGDGDLDIAISINNTGQIALLEQIVRAFLTPAPDLNPITNFTTHIVASGIPEPRDVALADIDTDPLLEITSGSSLQDTINWHKYHPGAPASGLFTANVVTTDSNHMRAVAVSDLNHDLLPDVISASAFDSSAEWFGGGSIVGLPAERVASDLTTASLLRPAPLDFGTVYVWKVDGKSAEMKQSSETWTFRTQPTRLEIEGDIIPGIVETDGFINLRFTVENTGPFAPSGWDVPIFFSTDDVLGEDDIQVWLFLNGFGPAPGEDIDLTRTVFATDVFVGSVAGLGQGHYHVFAIVDGSDEFLIRTVNIFTNHKYPDATHEHGAGIIELPELFIVANVPTTPVNPSPFNGQIDVDTFTDFDWNDAQDAAFYDFSLTRGKLNQQFFNYHPISSATVEPRAVIAADLNGDLHNEIITAFLGDGGAIDYFLNNGQRPPLFVANRLSDALASPTDLAAEDLDNDGDVDLLAASPDDGMLVWYENTSVEPTISFSQRLISSGLPGARVVRTVDLNGDGRPDVLTGTPSDGLLAYLNNGGAPLAFQRYPIDDRFGEPASVVAADLNGDGMPDLAAAFATSGTLLTYMNQGSPLPPFDARIISNQTGGLRQLAAGDVDQDGDADLVVSLLEAGKLIWFENDGAVSSPGFTERLIAENLAEPRAFALADLDNDRDPDLAVATSGNGFVAWYVNQGGSPPAFQQFIQRTNAGRTEAVGVGDIDGDQLTDFLTGGGTETNTAWNENELFYTFSQVTPADREFTGVGPSFYDRPGSLDSHAQYQWQVSARRESHVNSGAVWSFRTGRTELIAQHIGVEVRDEDAPPTLEVSFVVRNTGTATSRAVLARVLAKQRADLATIPSDILLGTVEISSLPPGGQENAILVVDLETVGPFVQGAFSRLDPGTYFPLVDLDPFNAEPDEFDEMNLFVGRQPFSLVGENSARDWTLFR